MPLTTATASAAIAHRHGLGALRDAPVQAGMAPHALNHATQLARHLGEPVLGGNRARLLHAGTDSFDAACKAIDSARDHINIEVGVVDGDGAGFMLADRLIARCRAGVRVNLLHDSADPAAPAQLQRLREAGVRLCALKPPSRWQAWASSALQLRAHRRLLVVDGRIGFIGGGGSVAHGQRGLTVQLEGPGVRRLQQLFIAQWLRYSACAMQQARYFPPLAPVDTHRVGVAACEAGRRQSPQRGALLGAIAAARSQVLLATADAVPPRRLLCALLHAAERGLRVELLLPGASDMWPLPFAGRLHAAQLLRAGVLIHQCQQGRHDGLLHAQACAIDGVWASVGFCTAGRPGLIHNAESNLVVIDAGFARQLEQAFNDAAAHARPAAQDAPARPALWQRSIDTLKRRFASAL